MRVTETFHEHIDPKTKLQWAILASDVTPKRGISGTHSGIL